MIFCVFLALRLTDLVQILTVINWIFLPAPVKIWSRYVTQNIFFDVWKYEEHWSKVSNFSTILIADYDLNLWYFKSNHSKTDVLIKNISTSASKSNITNIWSQHTWALEVVQSSYCFLAKSNLYVACLKYMTNHTNRSDCGGRMNAFCLI